MGYTNYPNGVTSFGMPLLGERFSTPWATHYFVDGDNGSDSNTGKEPDKAFATIQKAVTASSAQDVIYIRPKTYKLGTGFNRYTEDVTSTIGDNTGSGAVLTNALKSIIGVTPNIANVEYGGVRWKHASTCNLTNYAPALHVENIGFFSEGATYGVYLGSDGTSNAQRGADGTSFYNCVFKGKGIYVVDGGDGVNITNCRFHCAYDGTVACISYTCNAAPARRFLVRGCEWQDGNGTAPSGASIVVNGAMSELLIRDCFFGASPTGNAVISLTGSVTGLGANLHFGEADVSTDAIVESSVIFTGVYDGGGLSTST